jgi:phosphoribosyl 1,2-cyclic phosphate phosphodiesterase
MNKNAENSIVFLGTGAAQGVPPIFAKDLEEASLAGDRNLRTRSSLRLGRAVQIDAGPDVHWQLTRENLSWYDLDHLLITHSHSDHFYFDGILQKKSAKKNNGRQLHVYMSTEALDWFLRCWVFVGTLREPTEQDIADAREKLEEWYRFHSLDFFEYQSIGGLQICPLPGAHHGRLDSEPVMNYLCEFPDGSRLLYGVDTGFYDESVFEFLTGLRLDMLILDCTFGGRTDRPEKPYGHLDCRSFMQLLDRMSANGTIDETTSIYATHINPDQGFDHDQLNAWFAERPFSVQAAWDGLRLSMPGL